jgi:phosphatidylglycerol lysyltransferase
VTTKRFQPNLNTLARVLAYAGRLMPLLTLSAFGVAIWILWGALEEHHLGEVRAYFDTLPAWDILAAVVYTVASYVMLMGHDLLALRYVGKAVPLSRTALTSFVSYAFTNTLGAGGFGTLTGGSVRLRMYATAGLSGLEVTAVIAFGVITFALGLLFVGGLTLFFQPSALAALENVSSTVVSFIGLVMSTPVLAYLVWTLTPWRTLAIGPWYLRAPSIELAVAQIALSSLDLMLAGAALYVLMPDSLGLPFSAFIGLYVIAVVAGVISHVPGGLGVFDGILIVLLPNVTATEAAGVLLLFRVIYYFLPLALAAALLAGSQIYSQRHHVVGAIRFLGEQWSGLTPQITAFVALLSGAVLLVSGATPGVDDRLAWIDRFMPLGLMEASHLIASIVGMGLLLLSRALLRRVDSAYMLTMTLLVAGAIASLLKGLDYEEAILLSLSAALLIPARSAFYRHGVLTRQRFSGAWFAAVVVIVMGSIWLGLFSYRNIAYAHSLWWQFEIEGDAPRFLRATVAIILVGMVYAASQLLRPIPVAPPPPRQEDIERLMPIVASEPETRAALAVLGDKRLMFSGAMDGFVMYGVRGRSWVALGDPIGPENVRSELAWKFRELCDQHDGLPVFYQVDADNLPLYIDLGLSLVKLGDEARVRLHDFDINRSGFRDLRYGYRRSQREGATFEVVPASRVWDLLPELRRVSDAWLKDRNTSEKGFSIGYFDPDYLAHFPCALVRKEGRIVAFSNMWLGGGKAELSVDLMRYEPHAVYGVMDFLFVELMLWGKSEGYEWFNLGMAPLSGLEARYLSPVWYRLGAMAYRLGDQFYNFQGLRKYKEKFGPEWRPKYLASPGGLALGRVLLDVATLISGGVRGLISR